MRRVEKILVPLDHSELARDVLDMALVVADRFGAELRVLRIFKGPASLERGEADTDLNVIERETVELRQLAMDRVRAMELQLGGDQVQAEVRAGPLVPVIHEAVEEHGVDLVVMGTHGRNKLSELFTGSTTEQIVSRSPASVLVLKPEGFPYLRD